MNIVKNRFKQINKGRMYGSLVGLCWATILLCLVLKLFGSKEFEMPDYTYNINVWIRRLINYLFYILNSVTFAMLLVKRKITLKETFIVLGLYIPLFVMSLFPVTAPIRFVLETMFYLVIGKIILKDKFWKILIEVILIQFIINSYQVISMLYKNINLKITIDNFIVDKIMMIDYYMFIILTYLDFSEKGEYIYGRWSKFLVVLSNKIRSKKSIRQIQSNLQEKSVEDNSKGFKLFALMLAIFQFMLVFTLCYFINSTTWQFVVIFVSFCIMRAVFGKSYHANSIITCTTLSCVVFVIATRLSLPPYISILCNVIIGLLVAYMMYVLYYFNKYTTSQGITISRGMSKESLDEILSNHNLNEIETKILTDYYVKRKSLQYIATSVGYSIDNVKKLKAKLLKRIID